MPTPTVINKYRFSDVINRRMWDNSYFFEPFNVNPVISAIGGGAAAGAGAERDIMRTQWNNIEYFNIVGNTNLGPSLDGSFGLNLAPDTTSTHGVEYNFGVTPQNPYQYLIGSTPGFFTKATFDVATVAGASVILGLRKVQANQASLASYTDFAAIGIVGSAGHLQTETQIGSGGVVTTDTTQLAVNATPFTVALLVDNQGNVSYQINSQPPVVFAAYQFQNNISVTPFIRIIQGTGTATASSNYFEGGLQS